MVKICVFFVLIGAIYVFGDSALNANNAPLQDLSKAYDYDWFPDELEKLGIADEDDQDTNNEEESEELAEGDSIETGEDYEELDAAASIQSIEEESSKNLEEEVNNLGSKELTKKSESEDNGGEVFDANADYQIEDNRSELKDDQKENENAENKLDESDEYQEKRQIDNDFENLNEARKKTEDEDSKTNTNNNEDQNQDKQETDEESVFLEETKDILSEDSDSNDFNDLEAEASEQIESQVDLADETKAILGESDTFMDDDKNESSKEIKEKIHKESKEQNIDSIDPSENEDEEVENNDDDNVEKIYSDLQSDIDKLVDTWKKLQESDENDTKENADDPFDQDDILDYEEKYGRPFREGNVLQQREQEYENAYDDNLSDLFKDDNISDGNSNDNIKSAENDNQENDYEEVNDSNLSQIFKEIDEQMSKENLPDLIDDMMEENGNETIKETDAEQISREVLLEKIEENNDNKVQIKTEKVYLDDALKDDDKSAQEEKTAEESMPADSNVPSDNQYNVPTVRTMDVRQLSSEELDQFMTQFEIVHNNALVTDCDGNEGPIRKSLSVNEPLIVSSCGYPDRYPTNKVMDWILDGAGNGMGIELNVTNLDLNGALGDYLLINPGETDANSRDGIVFSFHLNSERKFRFLDVNRIFIRFESNPGMAFRTGFRLSIKLVEPLRELQPEHSPEPEALIPPPAETMTVNLGGVTLQEFLSLEEEFRRLVADMATMYINANNIDPGLNTTMETTQIVSRTICNIRWPNFENCAEVKFGIPLIRESDEDDEEKPRLNQEDLITMWNTYVQRDPFAARLRRMGVTEFAIPNDSSVLTAWVVIAVGVVISMGMLAFALWRFSCFEDYTRMAAYSDSDSFSNEKRGLDLYPTPHQTLPPLYSDIDYKWADNKLDDSTRVDMGGFANKSYVQDDLFNLDSDEDVIASRERSDKHMYTTDV